MEEGEPESARSRQTGLAPSSFFSARTRLRYRMESITVGGQDLLLPSLTPSLYSPDWQDWTVTASLTLAGYQLWAVEQR